MKELNLISNDERREVAARLRNLDEGMWGSYSEEYEDLRWACLCDRGEYGGMELHERLADLIEPEPERTCRVKNLGGMPDSIPILLCDSCGAFNYAKADGSTWNYCPACGAKVVGE